MSSAFMFTSTIEHRKRCTERCSRTKGYHLRYSSDNEEDVNKVSSGRSRGNGRKRGDVSFFHCKGDHPVNEVIGEQGQKIPITIRIDTYCDSSLTTKGLLLKAGYRSLPDDKAQLESDRLNYVECSSNEEVTNDDEVTNDELYESLHALIEVDSVGVNPGNALISKDQQGAKEDEAQQNRYQPVLSGNQSVERSKKVNKSAMSFVAENYQLLDDDKPRFIDTDGKRTILVSNLPPEMGARQVKLIFDGFGRVLTLASNRYNGVDTYAAFVTFANPESATEAFNSSNSILCAVEGIARVLRVERLRGRFKPRAFMKNITFKMCDENIGCRWLVISPGYTDKRCYRTQYQIDGSVNGVTHYLHEAIEYDFDMMVLTPKVDLEDMPTKPKIVPIDTEPTVPSDSLVLIDDESLASENESVVPVASEIESAVPVASEDESVQAVSTIQAVIPSAARVVAVDGENVSVTVNTAEIVPILADDFADELPNQDAEMTHKRRFVVHTRQEALALRSILQTPRKSQRLAQRLGY